MTNQRRVVITGMGIWSCLGQNLEEVTESLRLGRSGVGVEAERIGYGYQSSLTGIVPRPDLKSLFCGNSSASAHKVICRITR